MMDNTSQGSEGQAADRNAGNNGQAHNFSWEKGRFYCIYNSGKKNKICLPFTLDFRLYVNQNSKLTD